MHSDIYFEQCIYFQSIQTLTVVDISDIIYTPDTVQVVDQSISLNVEKGDVVAFFNYYGNPLRYIDHKEIQV